MVGPWGGSLPIRRNGRLTNAHDEAPLEREHRCTWSAHDRRGKADATAETGTYKDEETYEGHVGVAEAASGHANGGHNDEYKFDAIEAGPAIVVGQEAEQELAEYGAEEGEEGDE